ncbi:DUF1810 domain-containing protein [Pseudoduganella chitinolytica]|uniref:DUF1810 domain-containing protein n=1 Tax=Pseudoduganella chitinolytica TaxID=34070 RepID=A0ABY8BEK1_9BURK|nr:DUF1810 domain-containing protein [Pseudoduganella chitinolytica]WEF33693.1 DUF1810 domain-containing protein [Pseudoduganella chitinolytica]
MDFDLDRFISAQANVYGQVLRELCDGRKTSHWMWFVFPQLRGLGQSETSRFYGIESLAEARAYLNDVVLGDRLCECTELVNGHAGQPIEKILGSVDALKFRSSMTLFSRATHDNALFKRALDLFFGGRPDETTLELLQMQVGGRPMVPGTSLRAATP